MNKRILTTAILATLLVGCNDGESKTNTEIDATAFSELTHMDEVSAAVMCSSERFKCSIVNGKQPVVTHTTEQGGVSEYYPLRNELVFHYQSEIEVGLSNPTIALGKQAEIDGKYFSISETIGELYPSSSEGMYMYTHKAKYKVDLEYWLYVQGVYEVYSHAYPVLKRPTGETEELMISTYPKPNLDESGTDEFIRLGEYWSVMLQDLDPNEYESVM